MTSLDIARGPPMKRSRSDQGPMLGLLAVQDMHNVAADGSSVASAPDEIKGNDNDENKPESEPEDNDDDDNNNDEDNDDNNDDDDDEEASMSASVFEDALDECEDRPYRPTEESDIGFDPQQARQMVSRLRKVGAHDFLSEYYNSGLYTVRHLITAFGVRPDLPYGDGWYIRLLGLCIRRELQRRQKLVQYNTIEDTVALLQKSDNILVITGAGISTSLGIPDFRSKNTGFYSKLLERGFAEPEDVFDIRLFDEDPTVFYSLAKEILPVTDRCSTTHAFIKLLQDRGKLLTNYTQNIDNIEQVAGISQAKLLQCHGSWATARCRKCSYTVDGLTIFEDVKAQRVSRCKACETRLLQPEPIKKRKRGSRSGTKPGFSDDDSDGEFDVPEAGVMKPGITFFHEQLPSTFFDRLTEQDQHRADLVVVIGTSMKVSPVNEIPNLIPAHVPHIYISRDPCRHINFDVQLLGYCDDIVSELSRRAGWVIDHDGFDVETKAVVHASDDGVDGWWRVSVPGRVYAAEEQDEAEG